MFAQGVSTLGANPIVLATKNGVALAIDMYKASVPVSLLQTIHQR